MFNIFIDQEIMCGDRIDGGSDVLVLGSNYPQLNSPCNASNSAHIEIFILSE